MEFRLIYRGELPAETNKPRLVSKRRIRAQIHPQLMELCTTHRFFGGDIGYRRKFWESYADRHKVVSRNNHIYRFVPLIRKDNHYHCSLEILFMRRDMPGGLVTHGGDLDNRLKVLLDALRKPRETQEVEDAPQKESENPCFCLLEDDRYIDQISVTTDRLLSPSETGEGIHDVVLVIHVTAMLYNPTMHMAPM